MSDNKKLRIGCLIYTHERVDDAKINQEIIKSLWQSSGYFQPIPIIHAYNGLRTWYRTKHLEQVLIRQPNPGHFQGAADLIDDGIITFHRKFPTVRYVVVMAADTWNLKPAYIARIIRTMQQKNQVFATCPWGLPPRYRETGVGVATDFFMIDAPWAIRYRFFPLRYHDFWVKYHELISYLRPGGNVSVERLTRARFHEASFVQHRNNVRRKELAEKSMLILTDRMPVHTGISPQGYWIRRFAWPKIGLVTHHQPQRKQQFLRRIKGLHGSSIQRLLRAKDLAYYNQGQSIRRSYD